MNGDRAGWALCVFVGGPHHGQTMPTFLHPPAYYPTLNPTPNGLEVGRYVLQSEDSIRPADSGPVSIAMYAWQGDDE